MSSYRFANTERRFWFPLLAWIVLIYLFSTNSFSSSETSRFIVPLLKFLFPWLTASQLALGHLICRKGGHLLEYFVLGVLAWRTLGTGQTSQMKARMLVTSMIVLVALSDEFHQSFVPSRTSSVNDVGYDLVGGLAALFLISKPRNETRSLHSYSIL